MNLILEITGIVIRIPYIQQHDVCSVLDRNHLVTETSFHTQNVSSEWANILNFGS